MTRFAALLIFLIPFTVPAMVWHQGSVVLASGEVLTGEISRQSDDLILLRSAGEMKVLPAHKVRSFRYHDAAQNINRRFLALAAGTTAYYHFFETVTSGNLTVLRKQRMFRESIEEEDSGSFEFYIMSDGAVTLMKNFRTRYYNSIRHRLEGNGVDISSFDPNSPADALRLILLFNQLPATRPIAAI